MTIKQTYTLGYTAQAKLFYEISSKDGNLRQIVGHANLMHEVESTLLTAANDKVVTRNIHSNTHTSITTDDYMTNSSDTMQPPDGPLCRNNSQKTAVVHCEQTQQEEPIEIVAALRMLQSLQAFVASIPPVCVEDDSSDSNSDEEDDDTSDDSSESDSDDDEDFDSHTNNDKDLWQIPLMRSRPMNVRCDSRPRPSYDSRPSQQSPLPPIISGASHPSFLPLRGPGSVSWQHLWNDGDVYELWPTISGKGRRRWNGLRAACESPVVPKRHGLAHVLSMSDSSQVV